MSSCSAELEQVPAMAMNSMDTAPAVERITTHLVRYSDKTTL